MQRIAETIYNANIDIMSKINNYTERNGFMRKSIKRIAAALLAATMTMGLAVPAFGEMIVPSEIPADETIYTLTGNMTDPAWFLADDANAFRETEIDGVLSFDITVPAWDEANPWKSRFSIGAFNSDTFMAGWNRILLGAPQIAVGDLGIGMLGDVSNLTQIRIAPEEEISVTVYFDTKTYGLVVKDEEGNDVEYLIGWCTQDDDETYYTPEEFAQFSFDDYVESISPDRKANLEALGVTEIPDFVSLRNNIIKKLNGETFAGYSVVGSSELGIEWVADSESAFVKDNGDGTYSKTLVANADGDFEFKILKDAPTFQSNYQLQLGTGEFTENGSMFKLPGTVTGDEFVVTFNPETGDVTVTKNSEDFEYLVRWDTSEEADQDFLTKEEAIAKFISKEDEDEPADDPTDEPTDEPSDEPTDEPADEPIDEPTDEPSDEPADEPSETPTDNGSEENPNTGATAGSAAMLAILGGAAIIAVKKKSDK